MKTRGAEIQSRSLGQSPLTCHLDVTGEISKPLLIEAPEILGLFVLEQS